MTPFRPEYAGKMNFYLAAVDGLLRHPDDKPSIGLILCKTKNRIIAEYALSHPSWCVWRLVWGRRVHPESRAAGLAIVPFFAMIVANG